MSAGDGVATRLATWATGLVPSAGDLALADRSLRDTVAVAVAARDEPILDVAGAMSGPGRWAVASHILDFDDLHMPTTTHISTVCVPVALATGGGAAAYLAGAGVMARVGLLLGWRHYAAGWHATTTTGALGAAVTAAHAHGLDAPATARAIALAVPAAGGVQRCFGTDAKSLQVGMAAEAGMRAADLAAAGATAEPAAVDAWLALLGGDPGAVVEDGDAVPGGLAIKIYPCCYALQRPVAATAAVAARVDPGAVRRVVVRTPAGTVTPLIHARPRTGLEAKFSLEYAIATALLDAHQGFDAFSDGQVRRPEAQRLLSLVELEPAEGGDWLLDGEVQIEIHTDQDVVTTSLQFPPGSPERPPTTDELDNKLRDCLAGSGVNADDITWDAGAEILRRQLPPGRAARLPGVTA